MLAQLFQQQAAGRLADIERFGGGRDVPQAEEGGKKNVAI